LLLIMSTTTETPKVYKVNIYNLNMVEQVLDDHAKGVLLDEYKEDYTVSNVKLTLGTVGCLLALLSHFAPIPFPKNIPLLIFCAVTYFIISGILQYMSTYIEKDIIMRTLPLLGKTITLEGKLTADLKNMWYWLKISGSDGTSAEMKKSVVEYYDSEGVFHTEIFQRDVRTVYERQKGKSKKIQ